MSLMEKWRSDAPFYKKVLTVTLPIIIQNFITNFIGLLDNIMVGQMGTDQMNGVSISNQLLFVFNLCLWGAMGGAGIFTAQYCGKGDDEGVRQTFRAKLLLGFAILLVGCLIFTFRGDALVAHWLHETDSVGNAAATAGYAHIYIRIMIMGLIPFTLANAYANTLRDIGETVPPMRAGVIGVIVNLILNYILIFGHLGFPQLGAAGAAIATVISRYVELLVLMIWTHGHKSRCRFIVGAYRSLKISGSLMKQIIIKGSPLALNEALWSIGVTYLSSLYAARGLVVVAANNIANTISNLFSVVVFASGDALAIIIGQMLGAGKLEEAREADKKILSLAVALSLGIGASMVCFSGLFPKIYKTEPQVQSLATLLIIMYSCMMPVWAILHGSYFTLRTGGQTIITFVFDCGCIWALSVPVCYVLVNFTSIPVFLLMVIVQSVDLFKCVLGIFLVKRGKWCKKIV